MSVLNVCSKQGGQKGLTFFVIRLARGVSHYIGAEFSYLVLFKSRKDSQPLSHSSGIIVIYIKNMSYDWALVAHAFNSATVRQKQVYLCKLDTSLVYIVFQDSYKIYTEKLCLELPSQNKNISCKGK